MVETTIIIFASILFGYLLRDGNIKAIEKKNKHIIDKLKPRKSAIIEYSPEPTEEESAEVLARRNAKENI
jgi:hypothetical protein